MKVERVEIHRVALPLRQPVAAGHGVERVRDVALVRLVGGDGEEGWGECGALGSPTYTEEHTAGAVEVLSSHLAPALTAADDVGADRVADLLRHVRGHHAAKAALELAVLDAELRASGSTLAARVGAARTRVPCGATVGLEPDVDVLLARVASLLDDGGYRRVKLKIVPGRDVEPARAVLDAFGHRTLVSVDANGTYDPADSDHLDALARLDRLGLAWIEQPHAPDELRALIALSARSETAICLDESVRSARLAEELVAIGAGTMLCVKPGNVGGYLAAARALRAGAEVRGAYVGGNYDTALGRSAAVALAATPFATAPGDLTASRHLFERDIASFDVDDGQARVPGEPGIGVRPDLAVVASLAV